MDTLSHALWAKGLFGNKKYFYIAIFFGILPDLFSMGLAIIFFIINGDWDILLTIIKLQDSDPTVIPSWTFALHNVLNSFIIAFSVIGIIALWKKELAFAMLGWPFHICLDFPFHSSEYFPNHIFWPISDFYFDGIPWDNLLILIPNFAGLLILFIWRKHQER